MQNKYFGDVGDFGKYGFLRWITGYTPAMNPRIRLGVHWYLTPDDCGPDGRHIGYLNNRKDFRDCDEPLYQALHELVNEKDQRSVSAVEKYGLLPRGTRFFSKPLTYADLPWKGPNTSEERLARRTSWMNKAIKALERADVLFLDPDNGIEFDTGRKSRMSAPKYAFEDEIASFCRAGKTTIVYQHLGRPTGGIDAYLKGVMERLHESALWKQTRPPCCCIFKRWGNRAFIILPAGDTGQEVVSRAAAMMIDKNWSKHFRGIRF